MSYYGKERLPPPRIFVMRLPEVDDDATGMAAGGIASLGLVAEYFERELGSGRLRPAPRSATRSR
jgi:hypothetical protein